MPEYAKGEIRKGIETYTDIQKKEKELTEESSFGNRYLLPAFAGFSGSGLTTFGGLGLYHITPDPDNAWGYVLASAVVLGGGAIIGLGVREFRRAKRKIKELKEEITSLREIPEYRRLYENNELPMPEQSEYNVLLEIKARHSE